MTPFTLAFNYISVDDLPAVGGKGANLGELTHAGFNVPPGFCVTTRAFACFMAQVQQDIYARLDKISTGDIEQLRRVGGSVRAALDEVALPPEVTDSVVDAWRNLGEDDAYAVRSSATAEDLPSASFAGQQDTFLNVRGQESLLLSVKRCFISLFTDRAILYRVQNGFAHREVALSVIVQRMVQPDVAGILFTADPISNNRTVASIDAGFGLGEALVSGLVSADLYQVDKRQNLIIKRQIAAKQIAIRSLAEGGTEQIEIAEGERTQPALTDAQVLELTELGRQIETHYGTPQDIEWALNQNGIYITQSRPITSLYPLPQPRPTDDALHVYISISNLQVMTDAMPDLAMSLWDVILPIGHENGPLDNKYVFTAGGRLFGDVSALLRHPIGRRVLPKMFMIADPLTSNVLAKLAQRTDFQAHRERLRATAATSTLLPFTLKVLRLLFWKKPRNISSEMLRTMDDHITAVKARLDAAPGVQARLDCALVEVRRIFDPVRVWIPNLAAGVAAQMLLSRLLHNVGDSDDRVALTRGFIGNVATEMNLAVGDLADTAGLSAELAAYLSRTEIDAQTRLVGVAALPGGDAFLQAWKRFIDTYGARGPSEIDLSRPRWSEDPTSLLQMVVNVLGNGRPGAHRTHHQQLIHEREAAAGRMIEAARRGWWGWVRSPLVRRLIRVSGDYLPLREHHKFLMVRLLALMKLVLLEVGHLLTVEVQLASVEDVWFLHLRELLDALAQSKTDLRALVAERRDTFVRYRHLTPPRVMTSDGEIPVAKLDGAHAPEGALIGSPVSAGLVEGVAKVVLDPSVETLEPGEILVAPFTDPGWTPLFVNAAGLITEVGGLMTHGSLVAREYGIPAVVGVLDATKRISTGQRVRVYGDAGYVELLDNEASNDEGSVTEIYSP